MAVERKWDAVARRAQQSTFTSWAAEQDLVLWTHCPHIEQLRWCNQQNIRTVIFCLWHELEIEQQATYREATFTLSPSCEAARLLQIRWRVARSIGVPWELGLPLVRKDPRPRNGPRRLLLPLFDGIARRVEMTTLDVLDRVLATYSDTTITVACSSSTLGYHAYHRLRQLACKYRSRVYVQRGVLPCRRPVLFQEHDLTVWPTHAENSGHWGLMSLSQGTPLACFQFSPLGEFVHEENAILHRCCEDRGVLGVPVCQPDYAGFDAALQASLKNPDYLRTLQQTVHVGLDQRRAAFRDTLARVFAD